MDLYIKYIINRKCGKTLWSKTALREIESLFFIEFYKCYKSLKKKKNNKKYKSRQ